MPQPDRTTETADADPDFDDLDFADHAGPRRRRWPSRPPVALDVVLGVLLALGVALFYVLRLFGFGMDLWAEQNAEGASDRILRAQLSFTWHMALVSLGLAAVAAVLRARWTAALQVLVLLALAGLALLMQHDWERSHPPRPAPLPSGYVPCYSGSGTCD
jgi:Family of unknown function (DUF6234)